MKKRMPVSEIMTKNVLTINVTNTLEDAQLLMEKNKIRHLPVVSGQEVIGMLSLTDLLRVSFVDQYTNEGSNGLSTAVFTGLTIAQVMVKNPKTVQTKDTILEVAALLAEESFHALPVLDGDQLAGIVTSTDMIKYLIELY